MDLKQTRKVIQCRKDLPGLSDQRQLPGLEGQGDGRMGDPGLHERRARPAAVSVGRVEEVRAERGQGREPSFLSRSHMNL